MIKSNRKEILDRLKYTLLVSTYEEVDEILQTLIMKENIADLYHELFEECEVNNKGEMIARGFFDAPFPSASLEYAMYNLLGWAPSSFLLKHRVNRVLIEARLGRSNHFIIPRGIFLLPRVEEIQICNMAITELPSLEMNCPSLKYLNLSRNHIRTIPKEFCRFSQLKTLDLSFNRISDFPLAGKGLHSLETLNLKANRFSSFPETVTTMKKLKRLDLSMNYLERVDERIKKIEGLQEFHLAFNQLGVKDEINWESHFYKEKQQSLGL